MVVGVLSLLGCRLLSREAGVLRLQRRPIFRIPKEDLTLNPVPPPYSLADVAPLRGVEGKAVICANSTRRAQGEGGEEYGPGHIFCPWPSKQGPGRGQSPPHLPPPAQRPVWEAPGQRLSSGVATDGH